MNWISPLDDFFPSQNFRKVYPGARTTPGGNFPEIAKRPSPTHRSRDDASRHPMAEQGTKQFPFEIVRSLLGSQLAAKLRSIEHEDKFHPHTQFVTALNCVLVWTQARTATLPTWNPPNERET